VAGVAAAVGLVVVAGMAMAALGLLIAGTLSAEMTTAVTNAVFLVLLVLSGAVVDADVLPDAVATVGALSPLGAAVAALRAVLDAVGGGSGGGAALAPAGALLVWGALGSLLAARRFRWEA
jgi:ABC-2 type transport system permease protein